MIPFNAKINSIIPLKNIMNNNNDAPLRITSNLQYLWLPAFPAVQIGTGLK